MSVFDREAILQAASDAAVAQEEYVKTALHGEFARITDQLVKDFGEKGDFSVIKVEEADYRFSVTAWKIVQEQLELAGFGVVAVFLPPLTEKCPSFLRCYRSKEDLGYAVANAKII